jgi:putative sigma-54 modulation protein
VIRAKDSGVDMYTSIDGVADKVKRKVRKLRERTVKGYHTGGVKGANDIIDEYESDDAEVSGEEEYVDEYLPSVTRVKSFDLPPISIREAVFALDYIDHDFYVFRDEDTGEVGVVYKRNGGGVGLIQPKGEE